MKSQKLIFLLVLLFSLPVCFGQQKPAAELYDETGFLPCDELKGRVDGLFIALSSRPDSKGLIIIPDDPDNRLENYRYESLVRRIIDFRSYDPGRVEFVHARSEGKKLWVQFWLVPPEAERVRYAEETWDYVLSADKPFVFYYKYDNPESDCPLRPDFGFYARLLRANPNFRGQVVIRQRSAAGFKRKKRELSDQLFRISKTPPDRIKFFYAKPERYTTVEYWLVPVKKK
ncbi:MAG: hypothetical protein JSS81_11630 [Acidobacteria bacterium]|nr:hypothetical protein [Acidobacteriota bacterium]